MTNTKLFAAIFWPCATAAILTLCNITAAKDFAEQAASAPTQRTGKLTPWNPAPTQQYFHGYACKSTCAGHIAGYNWAERKGIEEESQCRGNSKSFIEGCLAYVADVD